MHPCTAVASSTDAVAMKPAMALPSAPFSHRHPLLPLSPYSSHVPPVSLERACATSARLLFSGQVAPPGTAIDSVSQPRRRRCSAGPASRWWRAAVSALLVFFIRLGGNVPMEPLFFKHRFRKHVASYSKWHNSTISDEYV